MNPLCAICGAKESESARDKTDTFSRFAGGGDHEDIYLCGACCETWNVSEDCPYDEAAAVVKEAEENVGDE